MRNKSREIMAVMLLALLAGVTPLWAQGDKAESTANMPKVGELAPDFQMAYFDGNDLKKVSLEQYRGKKNVVLAFFIFAFTGG
ncbi:MAG TPA: hypothetical protein VI386_09150 [Candidatus Sulfotelmatobacter sp.]